MEKANAMGSVLLAAAMLAVVALAYMGYLTPPAQANVPTELVIEPANVPSETAIRRTQTLQVGDKVQTMAKATGMDRLQKQMASMKALLQNQKLMHQVQMEILAAHAQGRKPNEALLQQAGLNATRINSKMAELDQQKSPDAASFTVSIVQRIVMGEVQDFFEKVNIATEVGSYVVQRINE